MKFGTSVYSSMRIEGKSLVTGGNVKSVAVSDFVVTNPTTGAGEYRIIHSTPGSTDKVKFVTWIGTSAGAVTEKHQITSEIKNVYGSWALSSDGTKLVASGYDSTPGDNSSDGLGLNFSLSIGVKTILLC